MTKYKLSKIGENVVKINTWHPSIEIPNEVFPYIDLSSIDKDSKKIVSIQNILGNEAPSRARQIVKSQDVLIATVRPNLNGVAIIDNKYDKATASTGYCILRTKSTLDSKFLFYWVTSKSFINDMVNKASGASYPAVSDKIIKDSTIPLPPLEQQHKIASTLDAANELRQNDKALIEKYDELTQALFLDMFGNPFDKSNPHKIVAFEELTNRITYGFTQPMKHLNQGIHILTAKNIQNGYIDYDKVHYADLDEFNCLTDKSKPEKYDILITKDGSIGRTALLDADFPICINQSVALIKPKSAIINHKYLVGYLISDQVQKKIQNMGKGGGLKHLQITELAKFPTVLPSLELQNQFADRIAVIEEQKLIAQKSLEKSEELFNSLLQKAFKGELV